MELLLQLQLYGYHKSVITSQTQCMSFACSNRSRLYSAVTMYAKPIQPIFDTLYWVIEYRSAWKAMNFNQRLLR